MRKKYSYKVTLKDAVSKEKRTIIIKGTSILNAVLLTDEIKNIYEYISKIEIIEL